MMSSLMANSVTAVPLEAGQSDMTKSGLSRESSRRTPGRLVESTAESRTTSPSESRQNPSRIAFRVAVSARESLRVAGIDIENVAGRLGGKIAGEEIDPFGDVLRQHRKFQHRSLAIDFLEFVFRYLVGGGALRPPFTGPDFRAAQHRVRIDGVDADAMRRAFQRQAPREVQ